ncbi:helix-turn-helix domain-containing protein [Oxalobacter sp. OttesenSCG-928-P03]|nr:helix-turn-helix domain-containing protein [Oxalobacter sp. OttesenSCG-928-P03]
MNIDEMKEEKDAVQSGASAPEEKNSDVTEVAVETEKQEAQNMEAEAKEVPVVPEPEPVKEAPKPGAQLAAVRMAAGIEQEQVAASLKMTVRQVRELEADNYEALHGIAISRGFIRAYAKMLQVDPEPFVAMFSSEEPASKQLDQIPRQSSSERFMHGSQAFGKKRGMGKTGWIILIVVVLAAIYGAHSMKWFSSASAPSRKKAEPVVTAKKEGASKVVSSEIETPRTVASEPGKTPASSESAATDGDKQAEGSAQKEEDKSKAGEKAAVTPDAATAEAEKQDQSKAREEKAAEASPEKAAAPAVPQNILVVRFNRASTVQVLRADSSVLREFDGRAGDVQKMEINEPVTLVVQKAANVEAVFREQPLALRPARRSTEARIELK